MTKNRGGSGSIKARRSRHRLLLSFRKIRNQNEKRRHTVTVHKVHKWAFIPVRDSPLHLGRSSVGLRRRRRLLLLLRRRRDRRRRFQVAVYSRLLRRRRRRCRRRGHRRGPSWQPQSWLRKFWIPGFRRGAGPEPGVKRQGIEVRGRKTAITKFFRNFRIYRSCYWSCCYNC